MQIREYHRRHPSARVVDAGEEYEQMFKEDPVLDFSGEVHFLFVLHFVKNYYLIWHNVNKKSWRVCMISFIA